MNKIKTILWAIDARAQEFNDSWWEPRILAYLDRYFRKGRHHDGPDTISGYAMRAWLKHRTDAWEWVRAHDGIQAAIALGY